MQIDLDLIWLSFYGIIVYKYCLFNCEFIFLKIEW